MRDHTPTPWELVEATEHHGPYIVGAYGGDVCDLYAMSNPMAASVRNGGNSFPVHFRDADANAAFIVMAVNAHHALVKALEDLHAMVVGECPSLLNEDSGGNARLDLEIRAALDLAKGAA